MANKHESPELMHTDPALERKVDRMMDIKATAPLLADAPEITAGSGTKLPANGQTRVGTLDGASAAPATAADDLPPDPHTDALVEAISRSESDELLAVRDRRTATEEAFVQTRDSGFGSRLRTFFAAWWGNKLARYGSAAVFVGLFGAAATLPTSRYAMMNTAGVRTAATLSVADGTTRLPLKNVVVELGDRSARTNQDGVVKLSDLKLGTQALTVRQVGFAPVNRTVTLGLGSNPLGDFSLQAVGSQFRFNLKDYLSGKPITTAEVSSGDANASADKNGLLVLTVDLDDKTGHKAIIKANGYRSESVDLDGTDGQPAKQSQTFEMVPVRKEVYVSRQSGKYDVYSSYIDGKDKKLLLAASGKEDAAISLVTDQDGAQAALVSRRDDTKNQDGFPLQTLSIIDIDKGSVLTLDHSERIQLVDWIGSKLVYVKVKAGTSAGNPERYQLFSYDYDTTSRLQLATANNFSNVLSIQGMLYYATSNDYQGGTSQFARINADSTGKQVLLDKTDVWSMDRPTYDTVLLSSYEKVYEYKVGDSAAKLVDNLNYSESGRRYLDAKDGKHSVYTDTRDGKGVLIVYNSETKKETLLATQSGITGVTRWLNARTVVYRVVTPTETADYAISLDGGTGRKVTDLTNSFGFERLGYR